MSQLTHKEQQEVLKLAARSKKPAFIYTVVQSVIRVVLMCWQPTRSTKTGSQSICISEHMSNRTRLSKPVALHRFTVSLRKVPSSTKVFPLSRHCREKPEAKPEHEQERETICDVFHKKAVEYFEDEVAMFLDCKMFQHQPHRKAESTCSTIGRL